MRQSIDPPEVIKVDDVEIRCDGDGGPLGHPRVYLSLANDGRVECPYCDRLFVLKPGVGSGDAHR